MIPVIILNYFNTPIKSQGLSNWKMKSHTINTNIQIISKKMDIQIVSKKMDGKRYIVQELIIRKLEWLKSGKVDF